MKSQKIVLAIFVLLVSIHFCFAQETPKAREIVEAEKPCNANQ
jgi:hypothetical protein